MSEWGRMQDVLNDEFDRQGVTGVDVNGVIAAIQNVADFFPGMAAAARALRATPPGLREALAKHHPVIEWWSDGAEYIACSCGWDGLGPRGGWPRNRPEWEAHFQTALSTTETPESLPISEPEMHRHDGLGTHRAAEHHRPNDFNK